MWKLVSRIHITFNRQSHFFGNMLKQIERVSSIISHHYLTLSTCSPLLLILTYNLALPQTLPDGCHLPEAQDSLCLFPAAGLCPLLSSSSFFLIFLSQFALLVILQPIIFFLPYLHGKTCEAAYVCLPPIKRKFFLIHRKSL